MGSNIHFVINSVPKGYFSFYTVIISCLQGKFWAKRSVALLHPFSNTCCRMNIPESSKNSQRGSFIVVEGIDRCGKTTQCRMLTEKLAKDLGKDKVEPLRFPNRTTTIGRMINDYLTNSKDLDDHTIHLLFSANRWESSESILTLLNKGITIICDRYAYSGVAFSAAKDTAGMDLEWCMNPDRGLPAPDGVIFLDISVEDSRNRGDFGQERYEKEDVQRKVKDQFLRLIEMEPDQWTAIDAIGTQEDVHLRMMEVASRIIEKSKSHVRKLWCPSI